MSGSKDYLQVDRVDAATCARAAQASVSDLHEAMGRPDCRLQTMDFVNEQNVARLQVGEDRREIPGALDHRTRGCPK